MLKRDGKLFLSPGELYFGREADEIGTLLGSCVAVTLWHPGLKIGGMCHVLLPEQGERECSARYADCAIGEFQELIAAWGTTPGEYIVGVYGGGIMFPHLERRGQNVGARNIEFVCRCLAAKGFDVGESDVGGDHYRRVTLDVETGRVRVTSARVVTGEAV